MIRRLVAAFVFVCISGSMHAQESRFVIERIEVRNAHRFSTRAIVAETLLHEGGSYTEDDVRNAVARLRHLPFLVWADYTLANGVVVINVTESRQFSFLVDARGIDLDKSHDAFDYDYSDFTTDWKNAALGARWFLGTNGSNAHFAMTVLRNRREFGTNYSAYEIGYTRQDLFGTHVFATLNVRVPVDSVAEHLFTPELIVGVPLNANQTITVDWEDTLFRRDTLRILGTDYRRLQAQRAITVAWTYNTTNEPYAPASGTFVRIAPSRWMEDRADFHSAKPPKLFEADALHVDASGFDFAALHYWKLSELNSVSAGVLGGWADVENRQNPRVLPNDVRWHPAYEILQGGYSRKLGASRLEFEGRLVSRQRNVQPGSPAFGNDPNYHDHSVEASARWVRRNSWGTLRLGVTYEHGN